MKKTAITLLLALTVFAGPLSGCERVQSPPPEEPAEETIEAAQDDRPSDEEFVAAAARALEARWDISSRYSFEELEGMTTGEYHAYLRKCVQAERRELGDVVEYVFHDGDLGEIAERYYYALDLQQEGAAYARTDSLDEYNSTWVLGYYHRVSAVYDLVSLYGLQVSEKYQKSLTELTAPWNSAKKRIAQQEFADGLPALLHYELDAGRSRGEELCYSADFENTSGYTISSMSIEVSCIDADGVVVLRTSDQISGLAPGERRRSTVCTGSTDFKDIVCTVTIYQ